MIDSVTNDEVKAIKLLDDKEIAGALDRSFPRLLEWCSLGAASRGAEIIQSATAGLRRLAHEERLQNGPERGIDP